MSFAIFIRWIVQTAQNDYYFCTVELIKNLNDWQEFEIIFRLTFMPFSRDASRLK